MKRQLMGREVVVAITNGKRLFYLIAIVPVSAKNYPRYRLHPFMYFPFEVFRGNPTINFLLKLLPAHALPRDKAKIID